MCSLIYILSAHSVFCECLLLVNIWQPILETHLKSENVNFQHYCTTSGAKICRGNELTDGYLTFPRRDSWYLLWFELELQKHHFPTPLTPLTLHATALLLRVFTIPSVEMLVPSDRSSSTLRRYCSTAAIMLAGTAGGNGCQRLATVRP